MPIALGLTVLLACSVLGLTATTGTLARFVDSEAGGSAVAGAATVVLGDRGSPVTLAFTGLRVGSARTVNLTIDYRGSVPATVQLQLPSGAGSTACVRSGSTWSDPLLLVGSLSIKLGSQPAVSYCSLLDGTARTVVAPVAPGTRTVVPITVTAGLGLSRSESAVIAVRAVGGFTDRASGTITITTTTILGLRAAAVAVPAPAVVPAAAPVAPAECAGLGPYAETVTLTADRPRFVAAQDRPGAPGPFLVIGTTGDDTITGSAGGDCVVAGAGADVVDGAGGSDALVGGEGPDQLVGGPGDDRLYGGAGVDTLLGGAGADILDGGADGASCADADASDTATNCTGPPAAPTTVPAPVTVAPTSAAPAPGPPDPTTVAPAVPTTTAAPAPAPADPAPTTAAPAPAATGEGGPAPEGDTMG